MAADTLGGPPDKRSRFEATAVPFMRAVYNTALRLTHRPEDASDLAQETYLRAYRAFESFASGTNCKAWLFTILYSVFVNRYRKRQREPRRVSIEDLEERYHVFLKAEGPADPLLALGAFESRPLDAEVEDALLQLPESFRSAVLLVDVEELSYEEAAAALGCPVGTLRSRLFRARRLLFGALRSYAKQTGYMKGPRKEQ
jgi:RNA polymerase sigma-70 factor (ECF subfamily)